MPKKRREPKKAQQIWDYRQKMLKDYTQKEAAEILGINYQSFRQYLSNNKERYGNKEHTINNSNDSKYESIKSTHYISKLNDYEWGVKYCESSWDSEYLKTLSNKLSNNHRVMCFLPRGTGKSTAIVGLIARSILECRLPVLLITSSNNSKTRLFNAIKRVIRSEAVLKDYGNPFQNIKAGFYCEFILKDEFIIGGVIDPVLKIAGRGEDIIGMHPRWIHMEDIIQEEYKSDESNENLFNWYQGVVAFCATHEEGKETRITSTGTRKSKKDFYHLLNKKLGYPIYTTKAIELLTGDYPSFEDYTPAINDIAEDIIVDKGTYKTIDCPGLPLKSILIAKVTMPEYFRTQLQNEPVDPEGNYFQAKHWHEVEWKPTTDTQYVIAVDPAFGKSDSADNTAIIVMARDRTIRNHFVIVEIFAERIGYEKIGTTLRAIYDRHPNTVRVVCESVFAQKILIIDKLNLVLPFTVYGFKSKGNKIMRIQSLSDPFMSKRITIWNKAVGRGQLFDEFQSYLPKPSTASRKDDALDATHMAYETWVRIGSLRMPSSGRTSSTFAESVRNNRYNKYRRNKHNG